jgi:transketolase
MNSGALACCIRRLSLEMVHAANASHIGGALSMADLIAVLYSDVLRVRPEDPQWPLRDRFILSKGHCCVALYAALATRGFFNVDELTSYGANESRLMTHISHKVPGVEFSTGSLGHGLPFAAGRALAAKRQLRDWKTYVILSDGELDEGSNWEAILFAPHHRLDNLVVIIDYNKLQSLGPVSEVVELHPLADKFRAFRWAVREIDGHNHDQIKHSLASAPWEPGQPSVVIAHTVKGRGIDFMEGNVKWHYSAPTPEQLGVALSQIEVDS